jgi:four helix bundle protein
VKKCYENRHIYEQLFRATTSAGANYEESHSAESGRDFLHKRLIVLKELRESFFWLKLIKYSRLINPKDSILLLLYNENEELIKIISKSISSSKNM